MRLWTIGHGTRPVAQLVEALQAHRVAVLADVRQFPGSRRNPQFGEEPLRASLEGSGIRYVHLVDLGGFRKGGYEAQMAGEAWQRAFGELEAIARDARTAVMCAEALPWGCHRRHIAAHALGLGWEVEHILDARRTLPARAGRQATLDPVDED